MGYILCNKRFKNWMLNVLPYTLLIEDKTHYTALWTKCIRLLYIHVSCSLSIVDGVQCLALTLLWIPQGRINSVN